MIIPPMTAPGQIYYQTRCRDNASGFSVVSQFEIRSAKKRCLLDVHGRSVLNFHRQVLTQTRCSRSLRPDAPRPCFRRDCRLRLLHVVVARNQTSRSYDGHSRRLGARNVRTIGLTMNDCSTTPLWLRQPTRLCAAAIVEVVYLQPRRS